MCYDNILFEPTCCGGPYSLFATSVSMCLCVIALNSFKIIASCIHVFLNKDLEKWSEIYKKVFYLDNATSGLFILLSILIIIKSWRLCYYMLRCITVFFLLLTLSRLFCTTMLFSMGEVVTEDGVADWFRLAGDLSSIIVFVYSAGVFCCFAREIYLFLWEYSSSESDLSEDVIA